MASTSAGYQYSSFLSNNTVVLFGSVLKYSGSSICVPSVSSTNLTDSFGAIFSFSLPVKIHAVIERFKKKREYKLLTHVKLYLWYIYISHNSMSVKIYVNAIIIIWYTWIIVENSIKRYWMIKIYFWYLRKLRKMYLLFLNRTYVAYNKNIK